MSEQLVAPTHLLSWKQESVPAHLNGQAQEMCDRWTNVDKLEKEQSRTSIHTELTLAVDKNLDESQHQSIDWAKLMRQMMALYDASFFENGLLVMFQKTHVRIHVVAIEAEQKESRAADYTLHVHTKEIRDLHLPVNRHGITCHDRLTALQVAFEHQLSHLIAQIGCTKATILAQRLFGHTSDVTQTPSDLRRQRLAKRRGESLARGEEIMRRIKQRQHEASSASKRHTVTAPSVFIPRPSFWDRVSTSASSSSSSSDAFPVLVQLQADNPRHKNEWMEVTRRFALTMPTAHIIGVQRIQNYSQWLAYTHQKANVLRTGGQEILRVFHGTRSTAPEDIATSAIGFDPQLGMSTGGIVWFASDALYSCSGYAYKTPNDAPSKPSTMKVMMANLLRHAKSPREPDSVVGHSGQIYEIRESSRCLGTHIIEWSNE